MSGEGKDAVPDAPPSRRQFLIGTGALAGGLLAAPAAQAAERVVAPGRAPAILRASAPEAQQAVTRYDVTTFTEGSQRLTSLRRGVATMKSRPASDPTSWAYQANIHNIFCNNPPSGYTVVHYSWRFLPWHRAYLWYFEKILRAASGDPSLSLPYWNWSVNLQLPAQYWGNGNPLFDPTRTVGPNSSVNPQQTSITRLLQIGSFPQFGGSAGGAGALEVGPHNYVHGWVGGDMGRFSTAALDPIFWAHHGNVDRVWFLWNQEGRTNPSDPAWLNISYPFYDIDQRANVSITFQQAAALPVTYAPSPSRVLAVSDPAGQQTLRGPETTAAVTVPGETVTNLVGPRTRAGATLRVVGVTVPKDAPVTVNVFAEQPGASSSTPTSDPGFAGSFTLIPPGSDHAHDEPVDLHVALGGGLHRALLANDAAPEQGAQVRFTLVPTSPRGDDAPGTISYDRLELHVP